MTAWYSEGEGGECQAKPAFPTSSAGGSGYDNGSLPIKIYDISSKVIPQDSRGDTDNRSIILSSTAATSNSTLIKSPITFYAGPPEVISQTSQTPQLYNYYWTSYSRGTDGTNAGPTVVNTYLNDYTPNRTKSLYDPCPYSYRTPTNGTYNLFPNTYTAWTNLSYLGGAKWTLSTSTWLPSTGRRESSTGLFINVGYRVGYRTAVPISTTHGYVLSFDYNKSVVLNGYWARAHGMTVRCIEDCDYIYNA